MWKDGGDDFLYMEEVNGWTVRLPNGFKIFRPNCSEEEVLEYIEAIKEYKLIGSF